MLAVAYRCLIGGGGLAEPLERGGGLVAPRYLADRLMLSIADLHNVIFFFPLHLFCSNPSSEDCCYCAEVTI